MNLNEKCLSYKQLKSMLPADKFDMFLQMIYVHELDEKCYDTMEDTVESLLPWLYYTISRISGYKKFRDYPNMIAYALEEAINDVGLMKDVVNILDRTEKLDYIAIIMLTALYKLSNMSTDVVYKLRGNYAFTHEDKLIIRHLKTAKILDKPLKNIPKQLQEYFDYIVIDNELYNCKQVKDEYKTLANMIYDLSSDVYLDPYLTYVNTEGPESLAAYLGVNINYKKQPPPMLAIREEPYGLFKVNIRTSTYPNFSVENCSMPELVFHYLLTNVYSQIKKNNLVNETNPNCIIITVK